MPRQGAESVRTTSTSTDAGIPGRLLRRVTSAERRRSFNPLVLGGFYAAFLGYLTYKHVQRYLDGGHNFQQGDWLINNSAGLVRRGLGGDALIWLSDTLQADLLDIVFALQFGLLIAFMSAILLKAWRIGVSDRLLFVLISPAFIGLWVNDFDGALRKEIIVALAFVPLLFPGRGPGRRWLAAGLAALLFSTGALLHEATVFWFPFFAAALFLAARVSGRAFVWWLAGIVSGAAALTSLAIAVLYPSVSDPGAMCAPLLDRGVPPAMCDGAIAWSGKDLSDALDFNMNMFMGKSQASFLVGYTLALLPLYLMLKGVRDRTRVFLAMCGSGLFFLPLYLTAIDWGRWVFMHVSSLTLLLMLANDARMLPGVRTPLSTRVYLGMLFLCLAWGMNHAGGDLRHGYLATAELTVKGYLKDRFGGD